MRPQQQALHEILTCYLYKCQDSLSLPRINGTLFLIYILFVGEDGSGKTTLMTKLQGAEHGKKGRGLEYLYLSVHDEDRDGK